MIETERLIIKPLTYNQLKKYMLNDNSLEEELSLNETSRSISPELKEALEQTILPNVADTSKNYLYSTLWTLISKKDNKMVGDLCFVGAPNADGEIEIGYGTYDIFASLGYMTEAVGGMISWAKTQPEIRAIIADTEKQNTASFRVLQKNGFVKTGETETLLKWRLSVKSIENEI
jgi:ribosomal-protein-alanine N-acetyltransferase